MRSMTSEDQISLMAYPKVREILSYIDNVRLFLPFLSSQQRFHLGTLLIGLSSGRHLCFGMRSRRLGFTRDQTL